MNQFLHSTEFGNIPPKNYMERDPEPMETIELIDDPYDQEKQRL